MTTLPVVVTISTFHETPLLLTAWRRRVGQESCCQPGILHRLVRCIADILAADLGFSGVRPAFSIATPLETSSTWPSSSAVMLATRL
jgi:hypothetical protein